MPSPNYDTTSQLDLVGEVSLMLGNLMNKKRTMIELMLREEDEINPDEWKRSLLFKIIAENSTFKIATIKDNISKAWKPIKIETEEDLFHMWNNGPRNYFNHLIA